MRVGMLATLGVVTLMVGCSSTGTGQGPTTAASTTTTKAAAASPTTISANPAPGSDPSVLHKQIGEHAYSGCPDSPDGQCDIDFVVTSIQSGVPCVDSEPIEPDEQLVRIDVDVTTAQKFLYPDTAGGSPSALYFANWGLGDASGVAPELDPYFGEAKKCISDQGLTGLRPGTHVQVSWLVKAPKPATVLRLYSDPRGDGWTWDVPPMAG